MFFINLRKTPWKFYPTVLLNIHRGSEIALYVSYTTSRTMYVVPMERNWKDDSNLTKYSKLPFRF